MEFNLNQLAELSMKQKKILYKLQERATQWLTSNFDNWICNWQDYTRKRCFENFTCMKRVKEDTQISIIIIYYKIGDSMEDSEFFTYKHTTNF